MIDSYLYTKKVKKKKNDHNNVFNINLNIT